MKALVCNEFGPAENLSLEERPAPTPGKGEILVDIKAAGVNFPDVLTVQGKYQFKPELPFVPGAEVAGIVTAVGEGVTSHKVGDKVISTLQIGGFSEQCVAPDYGSFGMGETMSFEQAAGFAITYGTSYYALKQQARPTSEQEARISSTGTTTTTTTATRSEARRRGTTTTTKTTMPQ